MSGLLVGVSLLVHSHRGIPDAIIKAQKRGEGVSIKPANRGKACIVRLDGATSRICEGRLVVTLNHGSGIEVTIPGDDIIAHGSLKGWPTKKIVAEIHEATCRVCGCEEGIPQWHLMGRSPKRRRYICPNCLRSWFCCQKL